MAPVSATPSLILPAEVTSFVGRRHDLVAVRQLFSASRLVTLTGMGGVGKTRLALQVGHEMRRAFTDGVAFIELAALTDPDLLAQTVGDGLGLRERPKIDALAALCEGLHDRQTLLILDNCEHLVGAVAALVDRILRAAPEVRILATSRHVLRATGEHVYPVSTLMTPAPEGVDPTSLHQYPSVALFADRAAAVVPGFTVTPDNAAAIVRLCNRLDGIPLAIELAAVRLRVLTVDALADRLDDRFRLLSAGARNLPTRQRTLQGLIDWSYDLCSPAERALWARCSVFAAGFASDALDAVCTDEALDGEFPLDVLAGLVEKSILLREDQGPHVRFRMLDTIREYGLRRLDESGDAAAVHLRHRNWFADLVDRATREWAGPRQIYWATLLHLDHANIRLALEYSMARPEEVPTGLRIAAQPWFWASMDHLSEAGLWLDRGLALLSEPSHELAWALATRGYIAAFQGDDVRLREYPDRARDMALRIGDRRALALANHVIGFRQSLKTGDIRKSIPLFLEAMRQYDEAGVVSQYRDAAVVELATTYVLLREFTNAAELVDELFARATAAGDQWNLSWALWLRALISLLGSGDADRAEADLLGSLRIKRVFRDTFGFGLALEVLAWASAAKGEAERAAVIIGGTDRVWESIGTSQLHGKRSRYEALARAMIGDASFASWRERGSRFSTEELVAYTLHDDEQGEETAYVKAVNPLTRREREVADLVADGMSNKEIAAKLVISLRTAEGHVERILAKRGFKTRAQIAAWVVRERHGNR